MTPASGQLVWALLKVLSAAGILTASWVHVEMFVLGEVQAALPGVAEAVRPLTREIIFFMPAVFLNP